MKSKWQTVAEKNVESNWNRAKNKGKCVARHNDHLNKIWLKYHIFERYLAGHVLILSRRFPLTGPYFKPLYLQCLQNSFIPYVVSKWDASPWLLCELDKLYMHNSYHCKNHYIYFNACNNYFEVFKFYLPFIIIKDNHYYYYHTMFG